MMKMTPRASKKMHNGEVAAKYGIATHQSDCDDDRAREDALHEWASRFEEIAM